MNPSRKRSTLFLLFLAFCLSPFLPFEANGFELKGFSDVTFNKSTLKGSESENGSFALDGIDLYVSELLTDHIELLTEMSVEGGGVDVERLQIGYIFNDALKIRAGRFHNVLGFYNTAYHHGRLMQDTVDRPFFLKFEDEGGLLPVHLVGLWGGGIFKAGPAILSYDLMLGNGPKFNTGIGELDPNNASDNNKNKVVSFRLAASPRSLPALMLIGSGNVSKVEDDPLLLLSVNQTILSLSVDYTHPGDGLNFLSEIYWIKDKDRLTGSGRHSNTLYFIQGGYTLKETYTPYVRYERSLIEEQDPYMIALSGVDKRVALGGIRYELSINTALKGEVRKIHEAGAGNYSEYAVQWAFTF